MLDWILFDATLPEMAQDLFRQQAIEYSAVVARLKEIYDKLMAGHRRASRRIATIPGVGPVSSVLLSIKVLPAGNFK